MTSNICAIPMVVIIGKLADKLPAKLFVPLSFFFQIAVMTAYMFV